MALTSARRPRTEEEVNESARPHTRKDQKKPSRSSDSDWDEGGNLITMIAKLTLRQEDQLNQLHLDKTFILFAQAEKALFFFRCCSYPKTGTPNGIRARSRNL